MSMKTATAPIIPHGYEYKGYKYAMKEDIEPGENCKIFHDLITPEGKTVPLDFSPYKEMTEEFFHNTVDRLKG